ncbi:T6SS effector phospholipase Tle3 domain-containing protein, partial [Pseudomonas aeruginosa]
GERLSFDERDNRGSVYLYFTPQDQTVGLANVQGIGWRGIAEQVKGLPGRTGLPQGFHQRIFTVRKRNGEKEKIGGHAPPHVYPLLLAGEKTWEDTGLGGKDRFGRANFDQGDSVLLTAPRLPLPTEARFDFDGTVTAPGENSASGVYQVRDTLD